MGERLTKEREAEIRARVGMTDTTGRRGTRSCVRRFPEVRRAAR